MEEIVGEKTPLSKEIDNYNGRDKRTKKGMFMLSMKANKEEKRA